MHANAPESVARSVSHTAAIDAPLRRDAETATIRTSSENPILRLFSSIWFGIILLTVILVYACIFSAVPYVRLSLELTEMAAFSHWFFATLVVLFCITLTTATIRRIRFNIVNLGVWIVHAGLLLLTGGSVWYFANKIEGDFVLLAPSIEIVSTGGTSGLRPLDQFPADQGQKWERTMPALGGLVRFEVLKTAGSDLQPVQQAVLRAQIGDGPAREVPLVANGSLERIDERLAVRLRTAEPVRSFYDRDVAALHYRKAGDNDTRYVALDALPAFRERFLPGGPEIRNRRGEVERSKRTTPTWSLFGFNIPTGWIESWRLPIFIDTPDLPFTVEVTGYLPYVAEMVASAVASDDPLAVAGVNFTIDLSGQSITRSLFARPAESLIKSDPPIEFRWVENDAELGELTTPMAGPFELTIEVRDPPVRKVIAVQKGQKIGVEGTPYELEVAELMPDWPLMSPGYEGASSPVARVNVSNGEKSYNRTVVQRFPHLSQDIDETGKRHRDGPYDANLVLKYRAAPRWWMTLIGRNGPSGTPMATLAVFDDKGRVVTHEHVERDAAHVTLPAFDMQFALAGIFKNAEAARLPVVEPRETRRPDPGRGESAVRLLLTGRGEASGWTKTVWCPFANYPEHDPAPVAVRVPNDSNEWLISYSRVRHDLHGGVALKRLSVDFFPGRESVETWRSDFLTRRDGEKEARPGAVYTNQTHDFGEWTFFQATASRDHWSFTGIGVGNRYGIWPMILGSIMVPVGCMYAFYVKPILRRRKQEFALAAAAATGRIGPGNRRSTMEVGA